MAESVLVLEGLTKRFGAVLALDGLSLDVRRGEIVGFLGPNGAGKTTTIRLLMDFLRPTAGRALVLGRQPSDPVTRSRVGFLPAELHLDGRYTARDVVEFFGRLRTGGSPSFADELFERFDLDPTRPVGQLSTGNKRKVGIVQAFMHQPELLLLDEPTSGLDPLLQHEFSGLLRDAVANGATAFLSSHVLPEIELLAGRVAIMKQGRLVALDDVQSLRERARQRIDLHFATPPDREDFARLLGVIEVDTFDSVLRLVVEGSIDPTIKAAASHDVLRVVSHDTDLEDVFLSYYRDQR